MSSINENSSAENRGAFPINNLNNLNNIYNINNTLLNNLMNNNRMYCTHCRSYSNHLASNCNHVTLRMFEHELFRKKEELVESNEEHKLLSFENFIYNFHIEIINGFYRKNYGQLLETLNEKVKKIMEYFWHPDAYNNEWTVFTDQLTNEIGWYTDRIGNRTISQNSFVYPSSLTNNNLLNRILMANLLMNELILNEQEQIDYVDAIFNVISNMNTINQINITNNQYNQYNQGNQGNQGNQDNEDEAMPALVDISDPLVQALVETQNHTHFVEDSERKFNINAELLVSTDLEETECQICYDSNPKNRFVKLNCNHEYCAPCIIQTMNNTSQYREPCCAFCRANMTSFRIGSEEDYQILNERIM